MLFSQIFSLSRRLESGEPVCAFPASCLRVSLSYQGVVRDLAGQRRMLFPKIYVVRRVVNIRWHLCLLFVFFFLQYCFRKNNNSDGR